ncbi:MAG TPA: type II toxin-antitoxin system prevent-host-death family antitoxin [Gemmatimonadota bacterium]|nr:type II toxin-antitoxin system prevent-host-death family antitoxin [Gemmatimonadota bacterium]
MKRASISDLKARLSQYLDAVKAGEEVLVTDRGNPVARISPVEGSAKLEARVQELIRTGRLIPPREKGRLDFSKFKIPEDPEGRGLAVLIEERREGR